MGPEPPAPAAPGAPGIGFGPSDPSAGDRLTARGRRVRLLVSLVIGGLLIGGTFWGSDDDFPFGPFRMFAYANKPHGVVYTTRVEGVDSTGRRVELSGRGSSLRRAELEGQLPRFQESPELLAELASAYHERHPDAPEVVRAQIYRRRFDLEDGRPTGVPRDQFIAGWDLVEGEPFVPSPVAAGPGSGADAPASAAGRADGTAPGDRRDDADGTAPGDRPGDTDGTAE